METKIIQLLDAYKLNLISLSELWVDLLHIQEQHGKIESVLKKHADLMTLLLLATFERSQHAAY